MIRKLVSVILAVVMVFAFSVTAFAKENSPESKPKISKDDALYIQAQLEKHKGELKPATKENPYNEIQLGRGYVLYSSFQEIQPNNGDIHAMDQMTSEIVSTQGLRNYLGMDLVRMDFHTRWTYDYSVVNDGYSWVTTFNGLGYSLKATAVYGPGKSNYNREWDWTGSATFAVVVAGIDISTWNFTTLHLCRYDGSYAWRYSNI